MTSRRIGPLHPIVLRVARAGTTSSLASGRDRGKLPGMSDTAELAQLREQIEQQAQRIVELEIEAAFRRKAAEDLDDVVREQGSRLLLLERRVSEVLGQLAAATHEGEVD